MGRLRFLTQNSSDSDRFSFSMFIQKVNNESGNKKLFRINLLEISYIIYHIFEKKKKKKKNKVVHLRLITWVKPSSSTSSLRCLRSRSCSRSRSAADKQPAGNLSRSSRGGRSSRSAPRTGRTSR